MHSHLCFALFFLASRKATLPSQGKRSLLIQMRSECRENAQTTESCLFVFYILLTKLIKTELTTLHVEYRKN